VQHLAPLQQQAVPHARSTLSRQAGRKKAQVPVRGQQGCLAAQCLRG
jgi:hypothetical protein